MPGQDIVSEALHCGVPLMTGEAMAADYDSVKRRTAIRVQKAGDVVLSFMDHESLVHLYHLRMISMR